MTNPDPIDTGWRIHSALIDWTGKVDSKATFALTLESAILAGVITLSTGGRALSGLTGLSIAFYWAGIVALGLAVLAAVSVVRPKLRSAHLLKESDKHFIYFGHLNHLEPFQVESRLKHADFLPVLSQQLVQMSKIAWKKHEAVQWSLTLAPAGVALLGLSAVVT